MLFIRKILEFSCFVVECAQSKRKANFKMSKQLIYSGKAKDIYTNWGWESDYFNLQGPGDCFNGVKKEQIAGKGVLNNQISSLFWKIECGWCSDSFCGENSDTEQLNKKVDIIPFGSCAPQLHGWFLSKRFGVEEGIAFETPIVEFYYKNDDLDDPFINDEHVKFLKDCGMTSRLLTWRKKPVVSMNSWKSGFLRLALNWLTFKLEFGFDKDGKIILADEFSPDNCRLWDADGKPHGQGMFSVGDWEN